MGKIIIGVLGAAAGWLFLLIGPGVDGIINLQMLAITNNIILLGYAIALWGVIEESSQKTISCILKMPNTNNSTITATSKSQYYTPTLNTPTRSSGPLKVGDRIKVFKDYEIIKSENGCSIDSNHFSNLLEAEKWVNSQG